MRTSSASNIQSCTQKNMHSLQDWDGWLRKVTLQVKAAVDLASDGLNGASKRQLDNILAKDVVRNHIMP